MEETSIKGPTGNKARMGPIGGLGLRADRKWTSTASKSPLSSVGGRKEESREGINMK